MAHCIIWMNRVKKYQLFFFLLLSFWFWAFIHHVLFMKKKKIFTFSCAHKFIRKIFVAWCFTIISLSPCCSSLATTKNGHCCWVSDCEPEGHRPPLTASCHPTWTLFCHVWRCPTHLWTHLGCHFTSSYPTSWGILTTPSTLGPNFFEDVCQRNGSCKPSWNNSQNIP